MHKIATYLDHDHRRCDDQYAMAESAVILRHWDAASALCDPQADFVLAQQADEVLASMEDLEQTEWSAA